VRGERVNQTGGDTLIGSSLTSAADCERKSFTLKACRYGSRGSPPVSDARLIPSA